MKKILFAMFLVLAFLGCSEKDETEEKKEIIIEAGTITSPATWDGRYLINGSITIDTNITVAKCSVIRMANDATITISDNGSIKSIGTADCHVKFTSSKDVPTKGDWNGFDIYNSSSADSEFTYTIMEYAGQNNHGAIWVQENGQIKLNNSTFSNIKENGIEFIDGAKISQFTGNTFKNIEKYPIKVAPEQVKDLTPIITENNGINSVYIYEGEVITAGTWKNLSVPYESESFTLKAPISIEAGNVFNMKQDSVISVSDEGSIKSIGTTEKPIKFTSVKTAPAKGDWAGFDFYATSSNDNEFDYTTIEYSGRINYGTIWIQEEADIKISNTKIFESKGYGIDFNNGANIKGFENNTFENIENFIIRIAPEQIKDLAPFTSVNNLKNSIYIINSETATAGIWKNLSVDFTVESFSIKGGTISVEAGVTFFMLPNASINISEGGALKLMGTETEHITVISSKTAPAAKDWDCFNVYAVSSNDNEFNYTDIRHGGASNYGQMWVEEGATIALNNVTFSDADCDVSGAGTITGSSTYDVCPE